MSEEGIDEDFDDLIVKKTASLDKERELKQANKGSIKAAQPATQ